MNFLFYQLTNERLSFLDLTSGDAFEGETWWSKWWQSVLFMNYRDILMVCKVVIRKICSWRIDNGWLETSARVSLCPPSYRMLFSIFSVERRENLGLMTSYHSLFIHFPILNFQAKTKVIFISLIHAKHCLTFFKTDCQLLSVYCEPSLR